jgi:pimeloyl-ACP methyl ester carboxylesterase
MLGRVMLATALLAPLGVLAVAWAPARDVATLTTRYAPPPSRFITVEGMRVHVRDEGPRVAGDADDGTRRARPPVVLLHGTFASLHTWDGWVDSLSRERRVIRFDMPGFGLTGPAPDGDEGMRRLVRTTFAVMDSLGVARAVLAGNSLGGAVAWEAALAQPQRVTGLVLVDAVGYRHARGGTPVGMRVANLPVLRQLAEELLPKPLVAFGLREAYGDPSRLSDDVVTRYHDLVRREGNRRALIRRAVMLPQDFDTERLRTIDVPTLIVWGGLDRLVPPQHADSFHRDLSRSRVVVFPGLGHVPHEEDPARTVVPVRDFLRRLPGLQGVAAGAALRTEAGPLH